jgi:NADH-quinone oxidoreductase subunit C
MRVYKPKNNVQKKSYYNDRFYVTPRVPRLSIYNDSVLSEDCLSLTNIVKIEESYLELGHLILYIDSQDNFKVIKYLKDIRAYDFLMELTAVDYISSKGGFEVIYEMLSTSKRKRIRIKCFIKESEAIESVYPIFKMANFSEREMYDMYGIISNNHPFMKRILMPDDWHGYPLLKTYPLIGDETASWYEVDKIFGKESRDIIGAEIRDTAVVDRYDTERFSRLGHEVPYGTDISNGKEPEYTPLAYQEEGGVGLFGVRLITKFNENESKVLKERR